MSNPWFRMYAEFASDPVIQSMAFEDQRHYVIVLCMKCAGVLDRDIDKTNKERVILRGLGLDPAAAAEAKRRLMDVGLVDKDWQPRGWDRRQFVSDISTARVRKYRKTQETRNVSETPKETFPSVSVSVSKKSSKAKKEVSLPAWLPASAWDDWRQHRFAIKKPMTPRAEELLIRELGRLREAGHDPVAMIERAITRNWQSFYAPDEPQRKSAQQAGPLVPEWKG